jgi:hypothetical protein
VAAEAGTWDTLKSAFTCSTVPCVVQAVRLLTVTCMYMLMVNGAIGTT